MTIIKCDTRTRMPGRVHTPHKTYHQLHGKDELNVDGLHGVLADNQPSAGSDEIHLTPKASSGGPEGTIFYCSSDNSVYVGME